MRCYVDYTCGYSYRAWRWLSRLGTPVDWRTFSLKEANRREGQPPVFDPTTESLSVLALALAHAARAHDFARYHAATFEAFHAGRVTSEQLLAFATTAGVDTDSLDRGTLVAAVASEHAEARDRWAVFGTPTFLIGETPVFLRLAELPDPAEDDATWRSVETLAASPVKLLEIVRP